MKPRDQVIEAMARAIVIDDEADTADFLAAAMTVEAQLSAITALGYDIGPREVTETMKKHGEIQMIRDDDVVKIYDAMNKACRI